jgi:hypothetical protein
VKLDDRHLLQCTTPAFAYGGSEHSNSQKSRLLGLRLQVGIEPKDVWVQSLHQTARCNTSIIRAQKIDLPGSNLGRSIVLHPLGTDHAQKTQPLYCCMAQTTEKTRVTCRTASSLVRYQQWAWHGGRRTCAEGLIYWKYLIPHDFQLITKLVRW